MDREALIQRAQEVEANLAILREALAAAEREAQLSFEKIAMDAHGLERADRLQLWAHLYWECPSLPAASIAKAMGCTEVQLRARVQTYAPQAQCVRCGTGLGFTCTSRAERINQRLCLFPRPNKCPDPPRRYWDSEVCASCKPIRAAEAEMRSQKLKRITAELRAIEMAESIGEAA